MNTRDRCATPSTPQDWSTLLWREKQRTALLTTELIVSQVNDSKSQTSLSSQLWSTEGRGEGGGGMLVGERWRDGEKVEGEGERV